MPRRSPLTAAAVAACLSVTLAPSPGAFALPDPPSAAEASVHQLRSEIDQLRADTEHRIAALEARLAVLQTATADGAAGANPTPVPKTVPESVPETASQSVAVAPAAAAPVSETTPTPPPIPILAGGGGKNFLNLSVDGLFAAGSSTADDIGALEGGGHDPAQRGFTVQNVEMVLDGAVDPYFRAQANVVFQISPEGESVVELEEAYATTTSLPHGLQLKVGQFFTEFGRLNPSHPHSWDFVDQPLVNGRFFGPDGLRSVGARISWLLPTTFYSEAYLTVQNSQGETLTSFRGVPGETLFGREIVDRPVAAPNDFLVTPRYAASFDLSDTQTLLVGASAALGPNGTGESGKTRIYGVDGFWKWKPTNAFQGFPFVKVQGEVMHRDLDAAAFDDAGVLVPGASFSDWGGYLQVNWGYKPGHAVGLRFDSVGGDTGEPGNVDEPALSHRFRISPVVTWFPTEFSKLRLQYNFDHGDALAQDEHSLWLQLEFLLGAHAAHKF
ncbi:MAG: hypothetical protein ABI639_08080 [Thermoanaerobaculia bacterium]